MKTLILIALIIFAISNLAGITPKFFHDPALSPDGEMVCFNYLNDLWIVPWEGGEAKRITYSDGNDYNPIFSPCGNYIAFSSDRNGFSGIYVIPSGGGEALMVTNEPLVLVDWFNDGNRLLATGYDIQLRTRSLYTVYLDGRRPVMTSEIGGFFSKLSPCNMRIIFDRKGLAHRPAYTGSLAGEIWEYRIDEDTYEQLTFTEVTERYPVYSHVDPFIYYSGSDGNLFQVYRVENYDFENPVQLSSFSNWSARDLKIARDNDRIVFEFFDKIYRYEPKSQEFSPLEINISKDILSRLKRFESISNRADKFDISPNGKLMVFSSKFDLFAVPVKGGDVIQITHTQQGIGDIVVMDDNETVFFVKRVSGVPKLFSIKVSDLRYHNVEPKYERMNGFMDDIYVNSIRKLPNNKLMIDYVKDRRHYNKAVYEVDKGNYFLFEDNRIVISPLVISGCDRFVFYSNYLPDHYIRELYIHDLVENKNHYVFGSDNYIGAYHLSCDENYLFFNDNGLLVRLDFIPEDDFTNETDNWKAIFEVENESDIEEQEKCILNYIGNLANRRKTVVSLEGWNVPLATVDNSTMYFINRNDNSISINSVGFSGEDMEELLRLSRSAEGFTFKTETNEVFFKENDFIYRFNVQSRLKERVEFSINYTYCTRVLNQSIFEQVWVEFGQNFYDENMHGVDWIKTFQLFHSYTKYAYTPDILKNIIDEMIGSVNASHTGFTQRRDNTAINRNIAYGGFEFDYSEVLPAGIRLRKIYRDSKLIEPFGIREGDILLSVDHIDITPESSISELFLDKVGKRIRLKIETGKGIREIEILGLSRSDQFNMQYDNWVAERSKIVNELSEGRVGYLHIRRMNQESYQRFLQDFYAMNYHKEAIIIDVRNNGGGNISRQLLDVLEAEKRAYTTSSMYPGSKWTSPRRVVEKPLAVIINESSHSDSEIFPLLFSYLGIGPVIGVPTSGSVIGTTNITLMDGSIVRMPRSGWYTLDMINMEGTGAQPDFFIDMHPEDIRTDNDVQLKKAIEVILRNLE